MTSTAPRRTRPTKGRSTTASGGPFGPAVAVSTAVFKPRGFEAMSYVEIETALRTASIGGMVFDYDE